MPRKCSHRWFEQNHLNSTLFYGTMKTKIVTGCIYCKIPTPHAQFWAILFSGHGWKRYGSRLKIRSDNQKKNTDLITDRLTSTSSLVARSCAIIEMWVNPWLICRNAGAKIANLPRGASNQWVTASDHVFLQWTDIVCVDIVDSGQLCKWLFSVSLSTQHDTNE